MKVHPVSTPPESIIYSSTQPPTTNRYQLMRLIFGKATSFAPIMRGIRKLPRTAGATGTKKKNTMMMPCMENSLL